MSWLPVVILVVLCLAALWWLDKTLREWRDRRHEPTCLCERCVHVQAMDALARATGHDDAADQEADRG